MVAVKCPNCKTEHEYRTDNPFRPFCSERCRLQDLGVWVTEGYAISVMPANEEELEQLVDVYTKKLLEEEQD